MSASMLFNSICINDMIGSCRPGFNPRYRQNFSVGIFQDLRFQLDCFNGKKLFDVHIQFRIAAVGQGQSQKWALVHLCTCKAAANRSNVYVSGKNNKKILPFSETMQGISTSAESKGEERSKKK